MPDPHNNQERQRGEREPAEVDTSPHAIREVIARLTAAAERHERAGRAVEIARNQRYEATRDLRAIIKALGAEDDGIVIDGQRWTTPKNQYAHARRAVVIPTDTGDAGEGQ